MVYDDTHSPDLVEEQLRLDISEISDQLDEVGNEFEHHLRYGHSGTSGVQVDFTFESKNELVAHYQSFDLTLSLDWTDCNFGGQRPWLICRNCEERKRVLYIEALFHCRDCLDLTYQSSNTSDKEKHLLRRLKRIGQDLLPNKDLEYENVFKFLHFAPIDPPKPKNMHFETYDSLVAEWRELLIELEKSIWNDFAKITGISDPHCIENGDLQEKLKNNPLFSSGNEISRN